MTPRRLDELSPQLRALYLALIAMKKAGRDGQDPRPAEREGTRDARHAA